MSRQEHKAPVSDSELVLQTYHMEIIKIINEGRVQITGEKPRMLIQTFGCPKVSLHMIGESL